MEYLGAIEPAVAKQVRATRHQLGQADMAALVKSVREASTEATRTPETATEASTAPLTPERTTEPPERRYESMTVNGRPQLVDTKTGELFEPQDPPEKVITTETANPILRRFAEGLKLPADIEAQGISREGLHRTHHRFGKRLAALQINPATMPDVAIKYGHPDGLKQGRDGSYAITTSRQPKRGHKLNKTTLWRNYRHALSHATIDAIETERPDLFAALQSQLSESHKQGKRLLFSMIAQTQSPAMRLGLSLQLILFDRVPREIRGRAGAANLGQTSFNTVNDWRGEAALILAEANKKGWNDLADKTAQTVAKHKATINKKQREIEGLSQLDKLAGKRRKLLREIMTTETKLRAAEQLAKRQQILRDTLDPAPPPKPPWKTINALRSKFRKSTGENLLEKDMFASKDRDTNAIVWNVKKSGWHFIYDQSGKEIRHKRHKD